jgi:hypothetical protein
MLSKKLCVALQEKYPVLDTFPATRLDLFRNHTAGLG